MSSGWRMFNIPLVGAIPWDTHEVPVDEVVSSAYVPSLASLHISANYAGEPTEDVLPSEVA